jgi:hypothetical protein
MFAGAYVKGAIQLPFFVRPMPALTCCRPRRLKSRGILVTIELPNNDIARAASKGVDRRTLLKAGAWAAPVLVLTTALPAAAASTGVITTTLTQVAATNPGVGANRHNIFLNLTSTYATEQSVSISWSALPSALTWETGPAVTATVAANTTTAAAVAIGRIVIQGKNGTYTIEGEVTLPGGGKVPVSVSVTK